MLQLKYKNEKKKIGYDKILFQIDLKRDKK